MATLHGDVRGDIDRRADRPARRNMAFDETKLSFLTTEFWAMVGLIAAVLVATQQLDHMTGQEGWTLVSAIAIGYMLSRGLAKSGNAHRDRDF